MNTRKWIMGGALLFGFVVVGCDYNHHQLDYSDTITHQQSWDRDDAVRAYETANSGYNGSFACHTADGGCLAMSCATKASCDYMTQAEKRCAVPAIKDVQMADRAVVKDDKCESVQVPINMIPSGSVTYFTTGTSGTAVTSGDLNHH